MRNSSSHGDQCQMKKTRCFILTPDIARTTHCSVILRTHHEQQKQQHQMYKHLLTQHTQYFTTNTNKHSHETRFTRQYVTICITELNNTKKHLHTRTQNKHSQCRLRNIIQNKHLQHSTNTRPSLRNVYSSR
jgi:hypothetical protein